MENKFAGRPEWEGFVSGKWSDDEVNVRDFIQRNYTPYEGGEEFLAPATEATKKLWDEVLELSKKEREAGGVLNADTSIVSTLTSHGAGYIDKDLEKIVGLQTDEPFKRSLQPFGGIKMAEQALNMYGYEIDPEVKEIFTKYRKTHNDGVYDVYTPEMRLARRAHILTGLPDTYGRGRIVGDYRRVALYGTDYLVKCKERDKLNLNGDMTPDKVRDREEISEQIKALKNLAKMAALYGKDITRPAANAEEAVQWLYFGYLGAVKEQNGAAMSIGRNSTFLDIYIERDLKRGTLTEEQAQEIIDQFIMKLRIVKFMRIKEYNELFSGDPHVGNRINRRHGRRRQNAGNQKLLPRASHARKLRPRARTQPHGAVVNPPSFKLQKVLRKGLYRNLGNPVRKRRFDAPRNGRRLLHSMLRKLYARRQGYAVLRRARKPCKVRAVRPQRRRRRAVEG